MSKMAQQTYTLTKIRWLFLLLAVGDIASALSPRVPSLQERIEAYILGESRSAGKGKEIERRREVIEVDLDAKDATRIIEMGLNLVFICDTFGAGCVFYLREHFTASLYVWTSSSPSFTLYPLSCRYLPPFQFSSPPHKLTSPSY